MKTRLIALSQILFLLFSFQTLYSQGNPGDTRNNSNKKTPDRNNSVSKPRSPGYYFFNNEIKFYPKKKMKDYTTYKSDGKVDYYESYNQDGNLIEETNYYDSIPSTTTYTYVNNLKDEAAFTSPSGTFTKKYFYDNLRLVKIQTNSSIIGKFTETFEYNPQNNLITHITKYPDWTEIISTSYKTSASEITATIITKESNFSGQMKEVYKLTTDYKPLHYTFYDNAFLSMTCDYTYNSSGKLISTHYVKSRGVDADDAFARFLVGHRAVEIQRPPRRGGAPPDWRVRYSEFDEM